MLEGDTAEVTPELVTHRLGRVTDRPSTTNFGPYGSTHTLAIANSSCVSHVQTNCNVPFFCKSALSCSF